MADSDSTLKDALKEITNKYGAGTLVFFDGAETIKSVETISTGMPSLDLVLGGGFPTGRLIEVFGEEASGKTSLALHVLAKIQKATGKPVAYIDVENALDIDYAQKLGVDVADKRFLVNQPDSAEEGLDIVEKLCQTNGVAAIVVDSVAQLVPMAVQAKEIDGSVNIATTARLLSQTLPRISTAASKSGTTVIFLNQIRMKIGVMYGNPTTTPGGLALKFATSVRLQTTAGKAEARNGKEGIPVKITVRKNKIAPPFRKTELFLNFGEGFDYISNLLDTCLELGVINKSGGWYEYGDIKVQGWQTFVEAVRKNEIMLEELNKILVDSTKK